MVTNQGNVVFFLLLDRPRDLGLLIAYWKHVEAYLTLCGLLRGTSNVWGHDETLQT